MKVRFNYVDHYKNRSDTEAFCIIRFNENPSGGFELKNANGRTYRYLPCMRLIHAHRVKKAEGQPRKTSVKMAGNLPSIN
jgi:hypothetical protein